MFIELNKLISILKILGDIQYQFKKKRKDNVQKEQVNNWRNLLNIAVVKDKDYILLKGRLAVL